MRVTLQVDERTARVLHAADTRLEAAGSEAADLHACVRSVGGILRAVHPGVDDPALSTFFEVDVPDTESTDAVVDALLGCRGVQAAYVKPPDAPP